MTVLEEVELYPELAAAQRKSEDYFSVKGTSLSSSSSSSSTSSGDDLEVDVLASDEAQQETGRASGPNPRQAAHHNPLGFKKQLKMRHTADNSPSFGFRGKVARISAYRSYKGNLRFRVVWHASERCGPIWEDADMLINEHRADVVQYLDRLKMEHMNVFNRLLKSWPRLAGLLLEERIEEETNEQQQQQQREASMETQRLRPQQQQQLHAISETTNGQNSLLLLPRMPMDLSGGNM